MDRGNQLEEASKERKLYLFNHLRFTILYHEVRRREAVGCSGFECGAIDVVC